MPTPADPTRPIDRDDRLAAILDDLATQHRLGPPPHPCRPPPTHTGGPPPAPPPRPTARPRPPRPPTPRPRRRTPPALGRRPARRRPGAPRRRRAARSAHHGRGDESTARRG